jgi:hypothetical protein
MRQRDAKVFSLHTNAAARPDVGSIGAGLTPVMEAESMPEATHQIIIDCQALGVPKGAQSMTTDKEHREPRILINEAEFIAAEQAIADLRTRRNTLYAAIRSEGRGNEKTRETEAQIEQLTDEIFDHYDDIAASPPPILSAAIVKLRLLLDPGGLGLVEIEGPDRDLDSLRQVLKFAQQEERLHIRAIALIPGAIEKYERGDGAIKGAFNRWREQVRLSEAPGDADLSEEMVDALDDPAFVIADTPASGLVGFAIKAYLAVYQGADFPQGKDGALGALDERYYRYGSKGELHLSARLFRGLVADAVRFAPNLAPLAAPVINSPVVLPSGDGGAA